MSFACPVRVATSLCPNPTVSLRFQSGNHPLGIILQQGHSFFCLLSFCHRLEPDGRTQAHSSARAAPCYTSTSFFSSISSLQCPISSVMDSIEFCLFKPISLTFKSTPSKFLSTLYTLSLTATNFDSQRTLCPSTVPRHFPAHVLDVAIRVTPPSLFPSSSKCPRPASCWPLYASNMCPFIRPQVFHFASARTMTLTAVVRPHHCIPFLLYSGSLSDLHM